MYNEGRRCGCVDFIVALLGALFFFALGLVIGLAFFETLIEALPILIFAAILLAVLVIVRLIQIRCDNCQCRR